MQPIKEMKCKRHPQNWIDETYKNCEDCEKELEIAEALENMKLAIQEVAELYEKYYYLFSNLTNTDAVVSIIDREKDVVIDI